MPRSVCLSPHFRDFDHVLAEIDVGHPAHMRRVVDVTLDGVRIGATPMRMRTPYPGETRLEQKFGEALMVAHALVYAGLDAGAALQGWETQEMPDFTARIAGRDVGLEVASVTESAHADGILSMLRNAYDGVPAAADRFVDIALPSVPRAPKLDLNLVVGEIARLAADPTLREHEPVDVALAPVLAAAGAHISVHEMPGWPRGYITLSADAHAFSPREMLPVALRELADKQALAPKYQRATGLPIWLALTVTDNNGVYMESVAAFAQRRPEIVPFERVLFTDGLVLADSERWSAA